MIKSFRRLAIALVGVGVLTALLAAVATADTRQIPAGGTGSPRTGAFTPSGSGMGNPEFPGSLESGAGPAAFSGTIVDRSISTKNGDQHGNQHGQNENGHGEAGNPKFNTGFEGLNLYQQRYARGGNQFSVEPPDQALCVGNGYVFEAVNDVLNVYNQSGQSVLPDNTSTNIVGGFPRNVNHAVDLNSFYGYPPAVNRGIAPGNPGRFGQFVTDPSCLYDQATQRFFVVVLTLETNSTTGGFTTVNHLDIAVSKTANPTGSWNIYRLDVTNDGTSNPSSANACPCLGDYPHIGADANGFYVTTNSYPWNGNGFNGAQIYAFSKAQLAAGASSVTMQHIDTFGAVKAPSDAGSTQPGFTVWPAQSPGTSANQNQGGNNQGGNNQGGNNQGGDNHAGTEYFLSSNAADEATRPVSGTGGPGTSNQIVFWTLKNTASLNAFTPAVSLSNKLLSVNQYAIPPKANQPGSGTAPGLDVPQGHCINDTTTSTVFGTGCWRFLFGGEPAHNEVISRPDSNDTRMQQVMFANGRVWGALDTALTVNGTNRAGIAYYIINADEGNVSKQGFLGVAGSDLTYPAIGVTQNGRGVMAFTYMGGTTYPSAAYAPIDANGVGSWSFAGPGGQGAAVDDGFTSYKSQVGDPPRTRWGDYGAAAVDGNSVWIASEYIAHACDYTVWGGPFFTAGSGDNLLGTCAGASHGPGTRAALGNWSTRISKLTP
jgi:hypothetical protein